MDRLPTPVFLGFPVVQTIDLGSIPGLGKSPGGGHGNPLQYSLREADGSEVKNPPAMQETQETLVGSLGLEDPLEKEMATHSSGLKIPWTEEPVGLRSIGSQRVRHN